MAPEPVPLEYDWPGLDAERDGVVYDERAIARSAQALRDVLGRLTGEGGGGEGSGLTAGQGSIDELADFQRPVDSHGTPLHSTPASPLSTPAGPNHSPATPFGFPSAGTDLGSGPIDGRAAASHGMGSPFMPMSGTGGAGGQEEQDRETGTWLHEDDDIWSGDVGGVVDSRIG